MNPGAFEFRGKWQPKVRALRETGMGYTVVSLVLRDGGFLRLVLLLGREILRQ